MAAIETIHRKIIIVSFLITKASIMAEVGCI